MPTQEDERTQAMSPNAQALSQKTQMAGVRDAGVRWETWEGVGRGKGTQTVVTSSDHAGGKLPRKQLTQHGYQLSPWRYPHIPG